MSEKDEIIELGELAENLKDYAVNDPFFKDMVEKLVSNSQLNKSGEKKDVKGRKRT